MTFLEEKRDIRVTNQEIEKPLKIQEKSSNSLFDEIFEDGLNSLECAKIIFNHLKQIESGVKKLLELHEESKNTQIKVTESLQHLSHKFDEMENENKKVKRYLH